MIIYEVTTDVKPRIAAEYAVWLEQHIKEMLEFDGFLAVQWGELLDNPNAAEWITYQVQYKVESQAALDHYLIHHAAKMRQPAVDLFGDQFRASRRILEIKAVY